MLLESCVLSAYMGTAWSHNLEHLSQDFAALDVLPEGVDSLLKGLCCSGAGACFTVAALQSCLGELTSLHML